MIALLLLLRLAAATLVPGGAELSAPLHNADKPPLGSFGPVAPDKVIEVTGDIKHLKPKMHQAPSRFVVVMQAPRVGSKMLCSMLKSYDKGVVYVRMEGADRDLQRAMPTKSVAERIGVLFSEAQRVAKQKTPSKRGTPAALGFKTAKTLAWDAKNQTFGPSSTYDSTSAGPVWRELGVRVVCLARLNGFAWALSGARKGSKTSSRVTMGCSDASLRGTMNKTLEHVRQFYGECQKLGERTRALWVPYEAVKDGSPRQAKSLAAVLDFLSLKKDATLGADTHHYSPGASAAYVENAAECRAALAPNPYLLAMLDDPLFPYGKNRTGAPR